MYCVHAKSHSEGSNLYTFAGFGLVAMTRNRWSSLKKRIIRICDLKPRFHVSRALRRGVFGSSLDMLEFAVRSGYWSMPCEDADTEKGLTEYQGFGP